MSTSILLIRRCATCRWVEHDHHVVDDPEAWAVAERMVDTLIHGHPTEATWEETDTRVKDVPISDFGDSATTIGGWRE